VSYGLLNVPTSDRYGVGAQLACPGAQTIALTVANAAVVYQLGQGGIGAAIEWEPAEHFAIPGVWRLPPADAIQCRSAVAGVPAQISVSAYGDD
jgi:hypothetical protein